MADPFADLLGNLDGLLGSMCRCPEVIMPTNLRGKEGPHHKPDCPMHSATVNQEAHAA
jgi:hypothetical protein